MPETRSVDNTRSSYFNVSFYNIKYICNIVLVIFKFLFVLKKAVTNKQLNGPTEVVNTVSQLKWLCYAIWHFYKNTKSNYLL